MMQKSYENLFQAFISALAEVDARHSEVMESFGGSLAVCQDYLCRLRELFDAMPPVSPEAEIEFFKSIKPRFFAERIYRFERYQLFLNRPVGTSDMVRRFLEEELAVMNRFFESYRLPYLYFKTRGSEFDALYFLREAKLPVAMFAAPLDADPLYSTGMDYLWAKFIAFSRLREEILSELGGMVLPVQVNTAAGFQMKKRFDWTGEVINLVEMGYAIWLTGQLNEGKAGLQDIFRWLEESFGVEIGIPANRFREIRRRKRLSRTHFIEQCQSRLLEYMDEDDAWSAGERKKRRGISI